MKAVVARRSIGQEHLALGGEPLRGETSLDQVAASIDWAELDSVRTGILASAKGEPGWPSLSLFRALLLATWHDLSDMRLAEALDDRASFRRFCGFAAHELTPERTTFVRLRGALLSRGLDWALFEAVTRQLDARGVVLRTDTLVDVALLPSASIRCDGEARWCGHRRRKPVHGYKVHIAIDQEAGLIRGVEVTTANVHDAAELAVILPDAPRPVYGDTAYSGSKPEAAIRAWCGTPNVTHKSTWWGSGAGATGGAQRRGTPGTWADREGVRRRQALLRLTPNALPEAGPRGSAGQARGDGLQPSPQLASARGRFSVRQARIALVERLEGLPQKKKNGASANRRSPVNPKLGQNS